MYLEDKIKQPHTYQLFSLSNLLNFPDFQWFSTPKHRVAKNCREKELDKSQKSETKCFAPVTFCLDRFRAQRKERLVIQATSFPSRGRNVARNRDNCTCIVSFLTGDSPRYVPHNFLPMHFPTKSR